MHHAIVPGTDVWWWGLFASITIVSLPLLISRKSSADFRQTTGKILGGILLATFAALQIYQIYRGTWNTADSLPLQLCALSSILSGLVFFYPSQLLSEALIFWGISGALHSVLTPELVYGHDAFYVAEYYVAHAGIIASALYLPMRSAFRLRQGSWWRLWLLTQPILLTVGLINHMAGSNYMYLCRKPMAENPFVIGEWPWYIIGLQAAGLLHFWLIYILYRRAGWVRPANP